MADKPSDLIIARLLLLHSATHPAPRVAYESGMALLMCGEHTVQFDRDAGALFYAAAHQDVPALCARVRELEQQLDSHELERVRAERDAASHMATKAQAHVAELEAQLEAEVTRRTIAEMKARAGLQAQKALQVVRDHIAAARGDGAPGSKKSS